MTQPLKIHTESKLKLMENNACSKSWILQEQNNSLPWEICTWRTDKDSSWSIPSLLNQHSTISTTFVSKSCVLRMQQPFQWFLLETSAIWLIKGKFKNWNESDLFDFESVDINEKTKKKSYNPLYLFFLTIESFPPIKDVLWQRNGIASSWNVLQRPEPTSTRFSLTSYKRSTHSTHQRKERREDVEEDANSSKQLKNLKSTRGN